MTKIRVAGFSVSLDGFAAGPDQSLEHPLGEGGPEIFQWFFPTRTFAAMQGKDGVVWHLIVRMRPFRPMMAPNLRLLGAIFRF